MLWRVLLWQTSAGGPAPRWLPAVRGRPILLGTCPVLADVGEPMTQLDRVYRSCRGQGLAASQAKGAAQDMLTWQVGSCDWANCDG
jgi:hypothetical protein